MRHLPYLFGRAFRLCLFPCVSLRASLSVRLSPRVSLRASLSARLSQRFSVSLCGSPSPLHLTRGSLVAVVKNECICCILNITDNQRHTAQLLFRYAEGDDSRKFAQRDVHSGRTRVGAGCQGSGKIDRMGVKNRKPNPKIDRMMGTPLKDQFFM